MDNEKPQDRVNVDCQGTSEAVLGSERIEQQLFLFNF